MTPKASIIIVTYGQRPLTEQCLRSLERCLGDRLGSEWELVLVDNASPDDTRELLRSWSDRAIVKLLPKNRNFSGGCNLGAAEAHGEVLVFLNNDTEVTPGALETLAEQALEPGVSVAGCRLLYPNGELQHAGVAFLHGVALNGASMPQHVFHHQDQDLFAARANYEMDCVTAACMAVRASTFRTIDGFDEGYVNGLEDVDLCLRVRVAGERIVYRGDATVIHHEGASRGKGPELWATPARSMAMRNNDLRFAGRWATYLDQDDELAATIWDAALRDEPPNRFKSDADVVIIGQPSGLGSGADEARALLGAFAARGLRTAVADQPVPNVVARLSGVRGSLLADAQRRAPAQHARLVLVPTGAHDLAVSVPGIVRLAGTRTAVNLEEASVVWACSSAVASALVDAGLPPGKVIVVAPPVLPAPPGRGGGGALAILPVHAPAEARMTIEALSQLPRSTTVRLIPTVHTRGLERQLAETLPGAELLSPVSDEARFAELAAGADVLLSVDSSDRFERRALVAAGVGTAPITLAADGTAAAVLGAEVIADPAALGLALSRRLQDPGDRLARAASVHEACSPEALAEYLDLLPRVPA
jgi:GT2 family glycosyltransferase